MQLRQFISKIIREHLSENIEDYSKWKRKNVTLRGIKELGKSNEVYGSFGSGLYTVPLSNKAMAKQYGDVYFVVNAIPKNPKIVDSLNSAELLRQRLVNDFCKKNHKNYDMRFFNANTSMENEMLNLGYDGLIIKGREMVNYAPSDIKYFKTEDELQRYYSQIGQINEAFENKNVEYIYHGTGKGQALNIQRDGYMKPNKTGEEHPSISFTVDLDYAKYYAKSKGGNDKMCILRTRLTDDFHLSPRIVNNKGDEYVTFKNVPSIDLEVMTTDGNWQPLDNWNVIFDEPL